MEAIATLHRQLDDDDNGNIDLSESDDVGFVLFSYLYKLYQHFAQIAVSQRRAQVRLRL